MKRITTLKIELNPSLIGTLDYISFIFLIRTREDSFANLTQEEISKLHDQHYYVSGKKDLLLVVSFTEDHPMFNVGKLLSVFVFTQQYDKVKLAVYEFLKSIKYI